MCKHILNAQVSIRSPCCRKWFDCAECHQEQEDHPLRKTMELVFACKKCKKCFRKDASEFEESDEYCPHCDNHFVIEAKTPQTKTPQPTVEGQSEESEDIRMQRNPLLNYVDLRQKNDAKSIDDIMSGRVEKLPFNLR
ncbi:hypothetical protein VTN31DRAFT_5120 [Thermomyces dupontii]|uniref:uncharacterized protein n=1 Tax=Talaromyces thermophilus TaxID=28565 RepID=UPI003742522E